LKSRREGAVVTRGGAIEIAANGRAGAATPTCVGVHASAQVVAAWWAIVAD